MKITSFDEFKELARRGTFVPVCKEIVADLLTPVSAFLKIAEDADYAFLLESVEGGEHVGRYSFLGKDPFLILRARDGKTTIDRAGVVTESERPFIDTLRALMADFRSPFVPGLPRFTGGAVGYLGYGSASWFEPVLGDLGASPDGADLAGFMLFDTVLAFDHVQHRILIIANARITGDEDLESLYQFACAKIQFLERELERNLSIARRDDPPPLVLDSNVTRERFEEQVRTAKEHIAAGDIYQVVLSQRFEAEVDADPFTVYRALRHVNPSPYMYFVRMGGLSVVGSSPEMLVRVEGSRVETHPIAGTRPRGKQRGGGHAARRRAEAQREGARRARDAGRSRPQRRRPGLRVRHRAGAAVHGARALLPRHAPDVGRRRASSRTDRDRLDALVSCFPAGTVSGAPKVRAMQIIRDLEPGGRGLYAGAVGYLDFRRQPRLLHRDPHHHHVEGHDAYVQAGAGIVIDSNPTAEYEETRDKARALVRALELAQAGLK